MTEPTEIRRRLEAELDQRRERCDESTMQRSALVEHVRGLMPAPHFDLVPFLADWLWGRVPALGGLTPVELARGVDRLQENLGQQVAGVYV